MQFITKYVSEVRFTREEGIKQATCHHMPPSEILSALYSLHPLVAHLNSSSLFPTAARDSLLTLIPLIYSTALYRTTRS